MNKHFIQVTHGLLPVAVLALLAVAFIAGQARARPPVDPGSAAGPVAEPAASIIISADMLRKAEALPVLVDALTVLPAGIELQISLLAFASGDNDLRDSSSTANR